MGNVVPVAAVAAGTGGPSDLCGFGSNSSIGLSPAAAAAAADAAAAAAADAAAEGAAAAAGIDTSTPAGRHRKRMLQLEAKLQRYMDSEDRRVKELTEGVLYELLPSALNVLLPHCEDPLQELDAERCRAVAGAALAVSSLMNAPPGFLEFLLCIPWRQLPLLYPAIRNPEQQSPEQLLAHLAVDEQERRVLVNMRIHPQLMRPVLEFMYKPEHADSVPPLLRPPPRTSQAAPVNSRPAQQGSSPGGSHQQSDSAAVAGQDGCAVSAAAGAAAPPGAAASSSTQCSADAALLDVVGALLDGATPLHCAALRGNPAQVDHLLYCGADPTLTTAAGELPLELVPVCGGMLRDSGQRQCCCLGPMDQEVWECRSGIARSLIARRCLWLAVLHVGLVRFLSLAWLCILALFGLHTSNTSLQRPLLQAHVQRRRQQRLQDARTRTCALLARMRQEASQGRIHLNTARQKECSRLLQAAAAIAAAGLPLCQDEAAGGSSKADEDCVKAIVDADAVHTDVATCPVSRVAGGAVKLPAGYEADGALEPLAPATPSAAAEAAGGYSGTQLCDSGADHSADDNSTGGVGLDRNQCGSPCSAAADSQQPAVYGSGASSADCSSSEAALPAAGCQSAGAVPACSASSSGETAVVQPRSPEPDSAEAAFKCFVRAVHALQSLDLQGGVVPHMVVDGTDVLAGSSASITSTAAAAAPPPPPADPATVAVGNGSTGSCAADALEMAALMVLEDEQAELYCCWAESVLLKSNACSCPGCTALAVQAIRMAHIAAARLLGRMQKLAQQRPRCWRAVGQCLSRVVYAHIALLCQTEARSSPSRASVWRAQQCLQEWDKLAATGLVAPDGPASLDGGQLVETLRTWTRTAESDLLIAEALLGSSLGPATTLVEALSAALVHTPDGGSSTATAMSAGSSSSTIYMPVLSRPVSAALLDQLQVARGLAVCPSPAVKLLAAQVADSTARELSAGSRLKELLASRTAPSNLDTVTALAEAIAAAAPFSSLSADVEAAKGLHQHCCLRAEAAAKLQGVVDQVVKLTSQVSIRPAAAAAPATAGASGHSGTAAGSRAAGGGAGGAAGGEGPPGAAAGLVLFQGFSATDWEHYIALLEGAVEEAKDANVSVIKARKLIKELQAQLAAAEAAATLDVCMARRPCGSAALKAAMSKGEAAAAAISTGSASSLSGANSSSSGTAMNRSSSGSVINSSSSSSVAAAQAVGSACAVFSEVLVQRLATAKKRLEVERAAEALHKAALSYRALGDLAKLEAAILNARKVGAEELAPEEYRAASELRARLTAAARVKAQLEAALKALQQAAGAPAARSRQLEEVVEPVQAAIKEAARWEELLPGEAARAAEALEAWRTSTACEAKLSRALRDGSSSALLSRLISEAAAAGVKVASARRVLKLQQLLEVAMAAADEAAGSSQYSQLAAKLEAAEQGGVAQAVLEPARKLLKKLQAVDAKSALEAALKPHSDWSANTRIAALRAALDKAEDVLGVPATEVLRQQQQAAADCQRDESSAAAAAAEVAAADDDDVAGLAAGRQTDDEAQNSSCAAADSPPGTDDESWPAADATSSSVADQAAPTASAAATGALSGAGRISQPSSSANISRTDSIASSSAASDLSSTALMSAGGGAGLGSCCATAGLGMAARSDADDVLSAVRDLLVRAWQLLEQDQRQLEEIDRERAEQEKARRELKEKERAERQRAEAERAERGKAERQRAMAERRQARAKAAADRTKNLAVLWGSPAGSVSSSSSSAARTGTSASSKSPSGDSRRAAYVDSSGRRSSSGKAVDSSHEPGPKQQTAQRHSKTAAAAAEGTQGCASQQQRSSEGTASCPVPGATAAADSPSGQLLGRLQASAAVQGPGVSWRPQQHPASGISEAGSSLAAGVVARHMRSDSYDLLGSQVLALLDLHDAQLSPAAAGAGHQQQQQLVRSGLTLNVSSSGSGSGGANMSQSRQLSTADFVGVDGSAAASSGSGAGSHPATPKFSFVDLGGASWGLDGRDQSLKLSQPLNTGIIPAVSSSGLALPTASDSVVTHSATAGDLLSGSLGPAASGQGIWGSSLGLALPNSSTALPPLAPRAHQLPLRAGRPHRSNTEDGSMRGLGTADAPTAADVHMVPQQHHVSGVASHAHVGASFDSLSLLPHGPGPAAAAGDYCLPSMLSPAGRDAADGGPSGALLNCFGVAAHGVPSIATTSGLLMPSQPPPMSAALVPNVLSSSSSSATLHGYADYSTAAGDLALLSRAAGPSLGQPAVNMGDWSVQHQQQQQLNVQASNPAVVAAAAAAAVAAAMQTATSSAAAAIAGDVPAAYDLTGGVDSIATGTAGSLHLQQHAQYMQQLQLQTQVQQQQQQLLAQRQQQAAAAAVAARGLMPSQQHESAFGSGSNSLAAVGAVGQFSSSFAFGAPGLSAFSQAYTPVRSSLATSGAAGGKDASCSESCETAEDTVHAAAGSATADSDSKQDHLHAVPSVDAVSQLPDDLSFSPTQRRASWPLVGMKSTMSLQHSSPADAGSLVAFEVCTAIGSASASTLYPVCHTQLAFALNSS